MKKMTTAVDAAMSVFDIVKGIEALDITGNIYPIYRPLGSEGEDIVISTLALNADQMQEGVLNVNIHVPNLVLIGDNTQPNIPRLKAIGDKIMEVLNDYWGHDFNFKIDTPGTIENNGQEWLMNIRLRYYSIRTETV